MDGQDECGLVEGFDPAFRAELIDVRINQVECFNFFLVKFC